MMIDKMITTITQTINMVLVCVWEFVLSRLYANNIRGGNGVMVYVAFPSMLTVPSCVVNPTLQLGDAAKTVIMYGVMEENCCMPGQLIFTLAGPSPVEINVKIDMSGIWLLLVIAFLLKLVISHAVVIEPDTMLSRQSDNPLLCLPSNAKENVFGDTVIYSGASIFLNCSSISLCGKLKIL